MNKLLIITLLLFVIATPVMAADFSGEVNLGGRFVDGDNTDKSAKFLEYRDLDNQLTTELTGRMTEDNFYLSLDGENLGYDDQSVSISGGYYGQARFKLFFDELTHNYSLDDKSIYAGVGSNALTISPSVTVNDATTWIPLDYAIERQQIGAQLELTFNTPFFFAVNVTQTEKEGVMPWGVNIDSTTGGSDAAEIPIPVDSTTTNMIVKTGYRTKRLFSQIDLTFSTFENDRDRVGLPVTGTPDFNSAQPGPVYFGPDNDMIQIGGQLVLRDLPIHSVLSIRGSHATMESDAQVAGTKDGELTYTKAAVSLRSRPMQKLDTELSYSFLQKDNKAASFLYNGNQTHVFEYSKQHALLAATYRLNKDNRFKAGYDYLTVDRSHMRFDAEETDDHTLFAEWKNSSLDMATAKIRYEHLNRSSDFNGAAKAIDTGDVIYNYVRPFDTADKEQDKVRLMVDFSPADMLDVGFELNASVADYSDTVIGRTDEKTGELILDAGIRLPFDVKLYGYASIEKSEKDSNHVYWPGFNPTALNNGVPIPTASETGNGYNWYLERQDLTKAFGLKLEVPLLNDRLMLSSSYDYQKNDGEADFTANPAVAVLEDITAYDDYEQQSFDFNAKYAIKENMSVTVGYAYEKYELDDLGYNDYLDVDTVSFNYLTGAYADMDYEANIGYVTLSYKF